MIEYLKSIPFFCNFYGSKLERIAWNLFPMQYKKNQIIYSINDEAMNFYIIRQGSVKMEKTVSLKLKSRMPCGYKSEKFFSSPVCITTMEMMLDKISMVFPLVGYCQGMNYIIAFILIISGGDFLDTWKCVFSLFSSD